MAITRATPQNYPTTLDYRRACLRELLGQDPPAPACRAVLAGDQLAFAASLGGRADALDALPASWWICPSAAHPVTVIFTGFEPFGGHDYNPSWAAAQAACAALTGAHVSASARLLPVTFEVAQAAPAALFAEIPPTHTALVIHMGLAAARDAICLERYAHNTRGATPDNDGESEEQDAPYDVLEADGPPARETLLPLHLLIDLMAQIGHPSHAELTRDPGDYVCNATYYAALGEVERRRALGGAADALFVHIPDLHERAAEQVGFALGCALGAWLAADER